MSQFRICVWSVAASVCIAIGACGPKEIATKETASVTGEVWVDGSPANNLQVTAQPVGTSVGTDAMSGSAFTDSSGKFKISSYREGDGLPPGEYALTFVFGDLDMRTMEYGANDKLKGKYKDPTQSKHIVKVETGKASDLGKIELSSK